MTVVHGGMKKMGKKHQKKMSVIFGKEYSTVFVICKIYYVKKYII